MGPPLTALPQDDAFLREALRLAEGGRHAVEPNPPVGCVIVRDGVAVGRGFHRAYGGPHAEVEALAAAGPAALGATAYVSLEPCSTTGKTGPCTEALVAAGVKRVVWAGADPDPRHRGRAAGVLEARGVAVGRDAMPAEAARATDAFVRHLGRSRPWTIAKWAMSVDGRTSPAAGRGGRLSGPQAQAWLHDLRGRVEAVMVGVGTVLADDPLLTCRSPGGPPHGRPPPLRVVVDSSGRTPPSAAVLRSARVDGPVLLVHARDPAPAAPSPEGVERRVVAGRDGVVDLAALLERLHARGVRRLLVEGGTRLTTALLRAGLVDQVFCVVAPLLLGRAGAPTPLEGTPFDSVEAAPRLAHVRIDALGEDALVRGYVVPPGRTAASS